MTAVVINTQTNIKMSGKNSRSLRPNYYKQELVNSTWDVPIRYQDLKPVGNGVSGQVRIFTNLSNFKSYIILIIILILTIYMIISND